MKTDSDHINIQQIENLLISVLVADKASGWKITTLRYLKRTKRKVKKTAFQADNIVIPSDSIM